MSFLFVFLFENSAKTTIPGFEEPTETVIDFLQAMIKANKIADNWEEKHSYLAIKSLFDEQN